MSFKKKDIITASLIAVLLILIVGGCVMLASQHRNTECAPPIQSIGKVNLYPADEKTLSDTVDVSNYVNGSEYILYRGNTENGILYFSCLIYDSEKTLFFKYNTLNGNLAKIESETNVAMPYIYASGGYIYYIKPIDLSVNYLCRIPISGGSEQILTEYDPGNFVYINLLFVVENKVILSFSNKIFAYDIEKNKTLTLWDAEKNGFNMTSSNIWYYSGNLYFLASSETLESDIPTAENFPSDITPIDNEYLITLNIKTKKHTLLIDSPINCFYMTENEIIYIPKVHSVTEIDGEIMPLYSDKIISCDLDGKNPREIFSNLDVWAFSILAVDNEKIYVSDGYAETAKVSIKEIDINTGDVSIYRGK